MTYKPSNTNFYDRIIDVLQKSKHEVVRSVNQTMVLTYFEIGRLIVEEEQNGKERADYGKELLKGLSKVLLKKFGRGFSVDNLENMRRFYSTYLKSETVSRISKEGHDSPIWQTESVEFQPIENERRSHEKQNKQWTEFNLSWSHYLTLMRIDDQNERKFYEIEAFKNNWSVRELQRQYNSALYTRLALSRDKAGVKKLSEKGNIIEKAKDAIKDPYILEFLGLPEKSGYSESELEQVIIDKLENFLLELGTGFTFVARQKRISLDNKHFKIDLVFYNRFLKSFVLIDLKIGELEHKDIGQMQMYVNYYDREMRLEDENKTIGIILCQNKSEAVVKYTLPEDNEQIFASKYKTILPSKSDLKSILREPVELYLTRSTQNEGLIP